MEYNCPLLYDGNLFDPRFCEIYYVPDQYISHSPIFPMPVRWVQSSNKTIPKINIILGMPSMAYFDFVMQAFRL